MRSLICILSLVLASACVTERAPDIDEVTLERTTCFGACPAYTVTIAADGAVTYVGGAHTRVTGEQHGRADRAALIALQRHIAAADFFNLHDSYRTDVSDLPSYSVTVRRGQVSKRVLDYGGPAAGMPPAVRALEDEIDRVAGTERWVGHDVAESLRAPEPTVRAHPAVQ